MPDEIARCRAMAARCRNMADYAKDKETQKTLLEMADEYEQLCVERAKKLQSSSSD